MKRMIKNNHGLTLSEMLVASIITVLVIGGILILNQFVQSNWKAGRVSSHIIGQLETCMERFQKELRMTDAYQLLYYPAGGAEYSAVSFPFAMDDNGDGFIEIDAVTKKIIWDQTVIYHTYTNEFGRVELRRTVFSPRTSLSTEERQRQLNEVAVNGQPISSTPEYSNWDHTTGTRAICENDNVVLTVTPNVRQFDGYNTGTARSENVAFGSIPLAPGSHYITFTITGKNSASTGYGLGVDSFTIAPSGCPREAEGAAIYASGGVSVVNEDMSAYGSWGGNRQLEYDASGIDDFISFIFNYDQWVEGNFTTCSPDGALIEYSNRTGDGLETAGNNDYVTRLVGFGSSWSSMAETGASSRTAAEINISGPEGFIVRNVILSRNIDVEGRAIKITFDNVSSEAMVIDYASIMERASGANGSASSVKQVTFYDAGGGASISIAPASSAQSDWIDINNFDRNKDFLLTAHMPFSPGTHSLSSWAASDASEYSYLREGDITSAQQPSWLDGTYIANNALYTVDFIDASYFSDATVTSQIYDTGMDDPEYDTLSWDIAKDNYGNYESGGEGADLVIKLRSNDNKDALKASADWTGALSIDTRSVPNGSALVGTIGSGRYVQFQAQFSSHPAPGKYDYLKTCVLKNLSISWPGQSRIVDISGYFTKRPGYGIFSISVDGYRLVKGLETNLSISENISGSKNIMKYMTIESQPRNTGK